jgi:hypothetical protein
VQQGQYCPIVFSKSSKEKKIIQKGKVSIGKVKSGKKESPK